jgi:hypothetical protein
MNLSLYYCYCSTLVREKVRIAELYFENPDIDPFEND